MMKKQLKDFLQRFLPVLLGVYLGFILSNWNESRSKKHQAKILVENITKEIETNQNRLSQIIDYHTLLRDSVTYHMEHLSSFATEKPSYFKGLRTFPLIGSAYQTGNQTGIINELDINLILELNQLYTYQNDYNDYIKMIIQGFTNKEFSDDGTATYQIVHFLSITLADLVIKEKDLLLIYQSIQEKLSNQ